MFSYPIAAVYFIFFEKMIRKKSLALHLELVFISSSLGYIARRIIWFSLLFYGSA